MIVYTAEKAHPREIITIRVDYELLTACVKDEEVDPAEVSEQLTRAIGKIVKAMQLGIDKRKVEAAEK